MATLTANGPISIAMHKIFLQVTVRKRSRSSDDEEDAAAIRGLCAVSDYSHLLCGNVTVDILLPSRLTQLSHS